MAKTSEYKLGEFDFPRGWFMVCDASELGKSPLPLRFFGKDFALFRGESGRLVCMDAHCKHMGAHLAASSSASIAAHGEQIEGDAIRCPYHGWRYNHKGELDNIPDYDGPCPKAANLNTYLVKEVMGSIMMWHDPEGGEPEYAPPQLAEWDMPNWVKGAYDHLGTINTHPQEILDNMADSNHLGPTHGSPCEYFENEFKEHVYRQLQGGFRREYNAELRTDTWYTGPGLLISRQSIGDINGIEFIFHTPVEDGVTRVWHNNLFKTATDTPSDQDIVTAKKMQNEVLAAFSQDFDIWSNKVPALQILSVPTEHNFIRGRTWYRQFYNPRSRAPEFHKKNTGRYVPKHKKEPNQKARTLDD